MNLATIIAAKKEALRFLDRVDEYEKRFKDGKWVCQSQEGGALRRASLDLSRSLAQMRKP